MTWQDTRELMEWAEKEIRKAVAIPPECMMTAGRLSTADEVRLKLHEFYASQIGMDLSAINKIFEMATPQPQD